VSVKVAMVERFMRIDRNDEAYLAFDIDADLTSVFSWQGAEKTYMKDAEATLSPSVSLASPPRTQSAATRQACDYPPASLELSPVLTVIRAPFIPP